MINQSVSCDSLIYSFSKGYLGPAGLHEDGAYEAHCVGGATGYVDRQILTKDHIYQVRIHSLRY